MSIIEVKQLVCDAPGCYEAWQADSADVGSAAIQRNKAKAAGWQVRLPGGLDECPVHKIYME